MSKRNELDEMLGAEWSVNKGRVKALPGKKNSSALGGLIKPLTLTVHNINNNTAIKKAYSESEAVLQCPVK